MEKCKNKKRNLTKEMVLRKYERVQIVDVPAFYEHWTEAAKDWDSDRWPDFAPGEKNIACPLTGNLYLDPVAFDCLQSARRLVGKPFKINSGHRSV